MLQPIEGDNASVRADLVDIAYCSRVGRTCPNNDCPISITFQRKEDKELLMLNKKHLPTGIYANDEFPIHVKRIRDRLRPVFRMAKRMQEYKDKCKLEGDKLVINRVKYGIEDIGKLPANLSAYLAAEKSNSNMNAFHGELSPYSNFHPSLFIINNEKFHSAEHCIQYQKGLLSGDSIQLI